MGPFKVVYVIDHVFKTQTIFLLVIINTQKIYSRVYTLSFAPNKSPSIYETFS